MNQTTKPTIGTTTTEAKIEEILRKIEVQCGLKGNWFSKGYWPDQIMQLIAKEKKALLEEVIVNRPKADKTEAIKHRPDNSVGFMLGWNAYDDKLLEALAHSQANSTEERSEDREGVK